MHKQEAQAEELRNQDVETGGRPVKADAQVAGGIQDQEEITLAAIRLPQAFTGAAPTTSVLLRVSVGKPGRQEFFTVHPDEAYRADVCLLRLKGERDLYYVVSPQLICEPEIELEARNYRLYTYATRAGRIGLWPIPLPDADGRENAWHVAAHRAAELATSEKWLRLVANMAIGGYECIEATGSWVKPQWPEENFERLLQIGFHDRFINSLEHPVLRQLRGDE